MQIHRCSGGDGSKQQLEGMIGVQQQQVPIPPYFRCPISLDLMRDPVTLSTGQTYDRASIEKWVADGNATCPATMQRLHDFTLIPNHTLRRLIQDWCLANRCRGVQRSPTPKQPPDLDRHRLQGLVLSAGNGLTIEQQVLAIRSIRALIKESHKNRALLQESGAVEGLMAAFFFQDLDCGVAHELTMDVIEESSAALVVLIRESDVAAVAKSPHRLSVLSSVLSGGSLEARTNVGCLIERLAVSENFRTAIAETEGIMQGVVRLVSDSANPSAAKAGVKALFALCLSACSRLAELAVTVGAPAALVEHLPDVTEKRDAERTLATLELLCKAPTGRTAVAGHALAVPVLVRMILKVSDRATECAAGCLFAICRASLRVQCEAMQAGVLAQLLLLMQSDCTERAKRKAVELLKLFRTWWPDNLCLAELCRTGVVPF